MLFNTAAPLDTPPLTHTIDGVAPTTTLTATPVAAGGSDYHVQWNAPGRRRRLGRQARHGLRRRGRRRLQDLAEPDARRPPASTTAEPGTPTSSWRWRPTTPATTNSRRSGIAVPDDGSQANLGSLPTVAGTTAGPRHAGAAPARSRRPIRCSLRRSRASRRRIGPSHAAGVRQACCRRSPRRRSPPASPRATPDIGPMALLALPDGSVLVSGGPARNQLFRFTSRGRPGRRRRWPRSPHPIFDLALDAVGQLSGRRPAAARCCSSIRQTGAILGAVRRRPHPEPGDPAGHRPDLRLLGQRHRDLRPGRRQTFSHFSDLRVGSLAFAPDGTLWAATWPHNQRTGHPVHRHAREAAADAAVRRRRRLDRLRPAGHDARRPAVRLAHARRLASRAPAAS